MIIGIIDDLFFKAKVRTVANQLGTQLIFVSSQEELTNELKKEPEKIIVDLNFKKFDIFDILPKIDVPMIGYFSHVDVELKKKAEKFCTVYPRSVFSNNLPDILK